MTNDMTTKQAGASKGWGVMTTDGGFIFPWLVRSTRNEAMRACEGFAGDPWRKLYREGWRCVPVRITATLAESRKEGR